MIPWLDPSNIQFPPLEHALDEPNGLLAAGGNLSIPTLLKAYRYGVFPWYSAPDPILWWSPDPRTLLFADNLHISRSMQKVLRKAPFTVTYDQAFEQVIQACAAPRNYTANTWITPEIKQAYTALHEAGHAHSIEVWENDILVGGLYGIAIGCAFMGESMFSKVSNASKFALIQLSQTLHRAGYHFIDCQVPSAHLHSLGASDVSRKQFKKLLEKATRCTPIFSPWDN